jgi:DNA-binding MarR family transcriptional regulator
MKWQHDRSSDRPWILIDATKKISGNSPDFRISEDAVDSAGRERGIRRQIEHLTFVVYTSNIQSTVCEHTAMSNPIELPCFSATCRQASRAISQQYEEALRPAGIEGTHFTLTMLIRSLPGLTSSEIGARMVMDKTTVARTLHLMEKAALISWAPGKDRREKRWSLTGHGETVYQQAHPLWLKAQDRLRQQVGQDVLGAWQRLTFDLVAAVTDALPDGVAAKTS